MQHKLLLENKTCTHYTGVDVLNEPISYHKKENAVKRLKPKKSPGIDGLPNEVLTDPSLLINVLTGALFHPYSKKPLYHLFQNVHQKKKLYLLITEVSACYLMYINCIHLF